MRSILGLIAVSLLYPVSAAGNVGGGKPVPGEPDTLRVLVWNLWRGGNEVSNGPEKALQLIKDSKADVCLLQESHDINGPRPKFGLWAAEEQGWNAWMGKSSHICVLSRYEIKKSFYQVGKHCLGVELEDDKGRTLHAFSVWIDYKSYAPYHLEKTPDCSDADLLACETTHSGRLKQSKAILAYLERNALTSLQTPLLVGGDWNSPSHLDWTKATSEVFPHRRPFPFPVSKGMEANGFVDTYRIIYPDPVKHPGDTWSPLKVEKPKDRIDRLYYRTNREVPLLKPVRATIYPEKLEDEAIPTLQRLFPSDHAALLIEFEWGA
jgi:endonuclease/exonuclease/phosphatase family metal-dependent hydrolase